MKIETHRPLRPFKACESVADVARLGPPPPVDRAYDYCTWLEHAYTGLNAYDRDDNENDAVVMHRLRKIRAVAATHFIAHTKTLAPPEDAGKMPGWNRLTCLWVVICQLNVILEDPVYSGPIANLVADELVLDSDPFAAIQEYTCAELRDAISVVRRRLEVVRHFSVEHVNYVLALEKRTAQLIVGTDANMYDVEYWHDTGVWAGNRAFIVNSCWWFLHLKRTVAMETWFRRQTPMVHAAFSSERTWAFICGYARRMVLDDHRKGLRTRLRTYDICADDLDRLSYLNGISSVERVDFTEVMAAEYLPETAKFHLSTKYKEYSTTDFVESLWRRHAEGGGWGSGAASLEMHENIAALHVIASCFLGKFNVHWDKYYVIVARNEMVDQRTKVRQSIRNGHPFIVQATGTWYCVVPGNTDEERYQALVPTEEEFEEIMEDRADFRSWDEVRRETTWVPSTCVVDVIGEWARALLMLHDGRVFGGINVSAFLEQLI